MIENLEDIAHLMEEEQSLPQSEGLEEIDEAMEIVLSWFSGAALANIMQGNAQALRDMLETPVIEAIHVQRKIVKDILKEKEA